ncbi:hypothetical protein BK133_24285, partial [Paenibacillus sp. FSL H8-0548]
SVRLCSHILTFKCLRKSKNLAATATLKNDLLAQRPKRNFFVQLINKKRAAPKSYMTKCSPAKLM